MLLAACLVSLLGTALGASCPGASPTAYTAFHNDIVVLGSLATAEEGSVTGTSACFAAARRRRAVQTRQISRAKSGARMRNLALTASCISRRAPSSSPESRRAVEPAAVRTRHLQPTETAAEGQSCPETGRLVWDPTIRRVLRCDGSTWLLGTHPFLPSLLLADHDAASLINTFPPFSSSSSSSSSSLFLTAQPRCGLPSAATVCLAAARRATMPTASRATAAARRARPRTASLASLCPLSALHHPHSCCLPSLPLSLFPSPPPCTMNDCLVLL